MERNGKKERNQLIGHTVYTLFIVIIVSVLQISLHNHQDKIKEDKFDRIIIERNEVIHDFQEREASHKQAIGRLKESYSYIGNIRIAKMADESIDGVILTLTSEEIAKIDGDEKIVINDNGRELIFSIAEVRKAFKDEQRQIIVPGLTMDNDNATVIIFEKDFMTYLNNLCQ